ncbi:hypothetical protein [Chondromyces crocatus]|uniref:Antitoxin Xre/MbcA/ParS-like toxin-binding domain-containing protein n=1 Tax=Chondromyces crocatus TaxID=52 RepID=A0A0K1EN40_CHOCO|nr:hypothetical protein [Chondromyces crocatus]AKT42251.1 uncharacterized protein CMC5_064740 [Chondromyces crocatus]
MRRAQSSATKKTDESELKPLQAKFLERGSNALKSLAAELQPDELAQVQRSSSDYMALIMALQQPSARRAFKDPLAPARVRGVKALAALLDDEGGLLDAGEVAIQLRIPLDEVEERRGAGELIAVELEHQTYGYPAWQFVGPMLLPDIDKVLVILAGDPPLTRMRFFLSSHPLLGGKRPLDMLRRGVLDPVIRAAQVFGEQGAG